MILTREGRVPYRLRYWWQAVRIHVRDFLAGFRRCTCGPKRWRYHHDTDCPRWVNALRWQWEATFRANPCSGTLVAMKRESESFSYYEQAPTITYHPGGEDA